MGEIDAIKNVPRLPNRGQPDPTCQLLRNREVRLRCPKTQRIGRFRSETVFSVESPMSVSYVCLVSVAVLALPLVLFAVLLPAWERSTPKRTTGAGASNAGDLAHPRMRTNDNGWRLDEASRFRADGVDWQFLVFKKLSRRVTTQ